MAVLINQVDCLTSRKNLGLTDCIIQEGRLTGLMLVPDGWSINLTTDTFDKAYCDEQIQLGNFIPITGAVEAINGTPEPTTEEFQGGVKSVVRNGMPEYTFKYKKGGWKFAAALHTYNSFQAYDVLFIFSTGTIAGASTGTTFTGFDLGMLNTGTYMFNDGTASSYVNLSMQLVNPNQFNTEVALLDAAVLDFNANTELNPITDIVLTARADASEAKVYFKAQFEVNRATNLLGIAIANLKSYVNGVADTITAASLSYNTVTSEYQYTPTAVLVASDTVVVELYDSVNVIDTAIIGGKPYKGQSNTAVTVA